MSQPFITLPYLQLGDNPHRKHSTDRLALLWQTTDANRDNWQVVVEQQKRVVLQPHKQQRIPMIAEPISRMYHTHLTNLILGEPFTYRVFWHGQEVFTGRARARPRPGQKQRFAVIADIGVGSPGQRQVICHAYRENPDYAVFAGDLVYMRGTIAEYQSNFFPIYNAERDHPETGAPFLRSVLTVGAVGNHDAEIVKANENPDSLGYFHYWNQPLNGPIKRANTTGAPRIEGTETAQQNLLRTLDNNFPRMANFTFSCGDVHWTILDSNHYISWTDPALRRWLENELQAARNFPWRLVAFHHPAFHASPRYAEDRRMRVLSDIFEKHGVALVFCGHVHNYQRSYPLRYRASNGDQAEQMWLDTRFDGRSVTQTTAPIYIVTGAGGAGLYDFDRDDPHRVKGPREAFTAVYRGGMHSLTLVELDSQRLVLRQISADGTELDRFQLQRYR